MAYWCSEPRSDADLSLSYLCSTDGAVHVVELSFETYQVMVAVSPFQSRATFCRRKSERHYRLQQIYRLYKHWSANAVDVDTLDCLHIISFAVVGTKPRKTSL
jgi:hypothetical protein